MIVPEHWAEARKQHRSTDKQITVRRYGWSEVSAEEARRMAETRAEEALQRILSGEKLLRREPRVAYNGATGVPIREEVLARHGEEVVTRNAYGARCLNSPRALFADLDFGTEPGFKAALLAFVALAALAALVGMLVHSRGVGLGLMLVALAFASPLAGLVRRLRVAARGGEEQLARQRIQAFLDAHPDWALRMYRTPAGLRLLATHRCFAPDAAEVQAFFAAVGADPLYVRMCLNQNCFRARLSAKPWRIGIGAHMRPRPGVWPVRPERMAVRAAWIADYEARAAAFAACRFVEALGSAKVAPELAPVIALHDRESRALAGDAALA